MFSDLNDLLTLFICWSWTVVAECLHGKSLFSVAFAVFICSVQHEQQTYLDLQGRRHASDSEENF